MTSDSPQRHLWLPLFNRLIVAERPAGTQLALGAAIAIGASLARLALAPLLGDRVPWFIAFPAVLAAALLADLLGAATALVLSAVAVHLFFEVPTLWITAAFLAAGSITGAAGVALRRGTIALDRLTREAQRGLELVAARGAELKDQVQELTRLHDFGTQVVGAQDRDALLAKLLEAAIAVQGGSRGFIELYDPATGRLVPGTSAGHGPDLFPALADLEVAEGQGATGTSAARRTRVIIEDTETDPLFAPFRERARKAGVRAVWSTPLLTRGGELVGVLSTQFPTPHRPSDRQIQLVELYARLAADAIGTATLYAHAERARREAEAAVAALQEADRRKDEFLAMMGHELRNPLASIRLVFDVARRRSAVQLTEKQLATVDRQSATLARLVDDLLDVARITQGKIELRKERVAIDALVSRAIDATQQLMNERGHRVKVELPGQPLWLQGDPVRLEQVLVNVLGNAAKYTPPGGKIEVQARPHGPRVELSVTDDGEGLEPAERERIFELFAQVAPAPDRSKGGLGLGLKIVRSLVEMHGGSVRAESDGRGKGARFVIDLPLAEAPAALPEPERPVALLPAPSRLKVLIVDDNVDVAESLRDVVQDLGHASQLAHSGPEALEAARQFSPDLVLLDIGLPGLDGYQVAKRLRDEGITRAPLVAITGYGQRSDREQTQAAGFAWHLVKPVQLEALQLIIGAVDSARQLPRN